MLHGMIWNLGAFSCHVPYFDYASTIYVYCNCISLHFFFLVKNLLVYIEFTKVSHECG